jgi:hypothetical protein
VPAGFDEVIAKGMAKDPNQRYQSAHELATAAHRALSDADPTRPVLAPYPPGSATDAAWQHTVAPTFAAAQQRGWNPAVPAPIGRLAPGIGARAPSRQQPLRQAMMVIPIAAIVVLLVVAGAILLLRPHQPASKAPGAQPSSPAFLPSASSSGAVPPTTVPSAAIAGLAPFVGTWQARFQSVVIDNTGSGHLTYQGCTSCPTQTKNTVNFMLTSVSGIDASGSVTDSSDAYFRAGSPVTAKFLALVPNGHLLDLVLGSLSFGTFCDTAANAVGKCGA